MRASILALLGPQERLRWRRLSFCERPPERCALGPQRPLAVARPLSPALARRGQTIACFLVWVHGTRTTVVLESAPPKHPLWIRELERASGRRLAPLSERSERWGAENASFTRESTAKFTNQPSNFTTADAFSGGRARARIDALTTKASANATSPNANRAAEHRHPTRTSRSDAKQGLLGGKWT